MLGPEVYFRKGALAAQREASLFVMRKGNCRSTDDSDNRDGEGGGHGFRR